MDSQQMYNNSWYPHSQSQRMPCYSPGMGNEYHFADDGDREPDSGIPYLSWRLNATDRPSLVHDYTR
ncbi:hypothetical protein L6164_027712 [Bauhinia variegata]|nr:hypothetical protein L6164_027712 [Bauhinia variegata]